MRGSLRQSMQRLTRVGACAVLVGAALTWPFGLRSAGADSLGRSFVGVGESSGGYVRYGIPGFFVVENFIDGGGPVSRASLGSDGTSQAFGSLPYPGSAGATYNGTVALATGSAPPAYPFYVSAFYPTQPEQKMEDPSGAYRLSAAVTAERAAGQAVFAIPAQGDRPAFRASAISRSATEQEEVRVEAASLTEGFVLGPLAVGVVRSESVTRYRKDAAAPVTTTAFTLDGGKVGDLTFSFGPSGLVVAKQGIPIPVLSGLAALNQALAPAGMVVRFAEPKRVPGGATATAFEVVSTAKVPGAGDGTFFIRLGGATTFITLGAADDEAASEADSAPGSTSSSDATTGAEQESAQAAAAPETPALVDPVPAGDDGARGVAASVQTPVAQRTTSGQSAAPRSDSVEPSAPAALVSPAAAAPSGAGRPPVVTIRPASQQAASASASGLTTVLLAGALAAVVLVGTTALSRRRRWTA